MSIPEAVSQQHIHGKWFWRVGTERENFLIEFVSVYRVQAMILCHSMTPKRWLDLRSLNPLASDLPL